MTGFVNDKRKSNGTGGRTLELCIIGDVAEYFFLLQRVLRRQQRLHPIPGIGPAGPRRGEHAVGERGKHRESRGEEQGDGQVSRPC